MHTVLQVFDIPVASFPGFCGGGEKRSCIGNTVAHVCSVPAEFCRFGNKANIPGDVYDVCMCK